MRLAPEGAASQFGLLHEQVKDVRADITDAAPPPDMQGFHRQLGRSVTLTQQAMDAMQVGFSTELFQSREGVRRRRAGREALVSGSRRTADLCCTARHPSGHAGPSPSRAML